MAHISNVKTQDKMTKNDDKEHTNLQSNIMQIPRLNIKTLRNKGHKG